MAYTLKLISALEPTKLDFLLVKADDSDASPNRILQMEQLPSASITTEILLTVRGTTLIKL
jgi:hypothetical protein